MVVLLIIYIGGNVMFSDQQYEYNPFLSGFGLDRSILILEYLQRPLNSESTPSGGAAASSALRGQNISISGDSVDDTNAQPNTVVRRESDGLAPPEAAAIRVSTQKESRGTTLRLPAVHKETPMFPQPRPQIRRGEEILRDGSPGEKAFWIKNKLSAPKRSKKSKQSGQTEELSFIKRMINSFQAIKACILCNYPDAAIQLVKRKELVDDVTFREQYYVLYELATYARMVPLMGELRKRYNALNRGKACAQKQETNLSIEDKELLQAFQEQLKERQVMEKIYSEVVEKIAQTNIEKDLESKHRVKLMHILWKIIIDKNIDSVNRIDENRIDEDIINELKGKLTNILANNLVEEAIRQFQSKDILRRWGEQYNTSINQQHAIRVCQVVVREKIESFVKEEIKPGGQQRSITSMSERLLAISLKEIKEKLLEGVFLGNFFISAKQLQTKLGEANDDIPKIQLMRKLTSGESMTTEEVRSLIKIFSDLSHKAESEPRDKSAFESLVKALEGFLTNGEETVNLKSLRCKCEEIWKDSAVNCQTKYDVSFITARFLEAYSRTSDDIVRDSIEKIKQVNQNDITVSSLLVCKKKKGLELYQKELEKKLSEFLESPDIKEVFDRLNNEGNSHTMNGLMSQCLTMHLHLIGLILAQDLVKTLSEQRGVGSQALSNFNELMEVIFKEDIRDVDQARRELEKIAKDGQVAEVTGIFTVVGPDEATASVISQGGSSAAAGPFAWASAPAGHEGQGARQAAAVALARPAPAAVPGGNNR
jgi:hypothetical protein